MEEKSPSVIKYAEEIIKDPSIIDNDEFRDNFVKEVEDSKYSTIIVPKEQKIGLFSILTPSDEYRKTFLMVAIIAYFNRVASEYAPGKNVVNPILAKHGIKDLNEDRANNLARDFAEEFLRAHCEYDPNKHAQSVYKEDLKDPSRAKKRQEYLEAMKNFGAKADDGQKSPANQPRLAGQYLDELMALGAQNGFSRDKIDAIRAQFRGYQDELAKAISANKHLERTLAECIDITRAMAEFTKLKGIKMPGKSYQDYLVMLVKTRLALNKTIAALDSQKCPEKAIDRIISRDIPLDRFYHFQRYYDTFYEQLREATQILVPWRDDIDFMVQFYDAFPLDAKKDPDGKPGEDRVEEFFNKYSSVTKFDIIAAQNGKWHYIGPYADNISRREFYNKNTSVLESMLKFAELNNKLGAEIAKKKAKKAKEDTIAQNDGETHEAELGAYEKYHKSSNNIDVENAVSKRELQDMAKRYKEMKKAQEEAQQAEPKSEEMPEEYDEYGLIKLGKDGNVKVDKVYSDALETNSEKLNEKVNNYAKKLYTGRRYAVARDGQKLPREKLAEKVKKLTEDM